MSGIVLAELDASDTLDILHFFFEEETAFLLDEQAANLTRIRSRLYENLYEREYKYGTSDTKARFEASVVGQPGQRQYINDAEDASADDDEDDYALPEPFDPKKQPRKAYIPTTPLGDIEDPFNGILDAPEAH